VPSSSASPTPKRLLNYESDIGAMSEGSTRPNDRNGVGANRSLLNCGRRWVGIVCPPEPPHPISVNVPAYITSSQRRRYTLRRRRRTRRDAAGNANSAASLAKLAGQSGTSEPGRTDATTVCCVLMLSVTGVGVDPTVKLAGVKVQAAYAGRFVQLIATVPVNAPYWLTFRLKAAGCPAGTVAEAEPVGAGSTKSGVVEVPEMATACAVTPAAPSVSVALLVPVTEGMKVILTVQFPPAERMEPQLEAAVKSGAFWPLTATEIFERGTALEFCTVSTCCALAPTGSWPNESDWLDNTNEGTAAVPLRVTVCGLSAALSVICSVACLPPAEAELNTTLATQLSPTVSELPQAEFATKLPESAPVKPTLRPVNGVVPELRTVTVWAAEALATGCRAKVSVLAERDTTGPAITKGAFGETVPPLLTRT
jgi:hypothetical protein